MARVVCVLLLAVLFTASYAEDLSGLRGIKFNGKRHLKGGDSNGDAGQQGGAASGGHGNNNGNNNGQIAASGAGANAAASGANGNSGASDDNESSPQNMQAPSQTVAAHNLKEEGQECTRNEDCLSRSCVNNRCAKGADNSYIAQQTVPPTNAATVAPAPTTQASDGTTVVVTIKQDATFTVVSGDDALKKEVQSLLQVQLSKTDGEPRMDIHVRNAQASRLSNPAPSPTSFSVSLPPLSSSKGNKVILRFDLPPTLNGQDIKEKTQGEEKIFSVAMTNASVNTVAPGGSAPTAVTSPQQTVAPQPQGATSNGDDAPRQSNQAPTHHSHRKKYQHKAKASYLDM